MNYSGKLVVKIVFSCLALIGITLFVLYYSNAYVTDIRPVNALIAAVVMLIVGACIFYRRNKK